MLQSLPHGHKQREPVSVRRVDGGRAEPRGAERQRRHCERGVRLHWLERSAQRHRLRVGTSLPLRILFLHLTPITIFIK